MILLDSSLRSERQSGSLENFGDALPHSRNSRVYAMPAVSPANPPTPLMNIPASGVALCRCVVLAGVCALLVIPAFAQQGAAPKSAAPGDEIIALSAFTVSDDTADRYR